MSAQPTNQTSLAVDVAVSLGKRGSQQKALIERQLVDFLLAVDETRSVASACSRLNWSTRHAQRTLKRFSDASGIKLLRHHGKQGTELTDEARQCIALYVATRRCVDQLARAGNPHSISPLIHFPH